MKTPEEFIQQRYDLNSEQLDDWRDQMKKLRGFDFENIIDLMESYSIEFAKMHVQAALKQASEEVTCDYDIEFDVAVDKSSILNAYDLNQIK